MPSDKKNPLRGQKMEEDVQEKLSVGKSWFFGIGINEYKFIQNLNNAKKDILDIQGELEQRYDLEECRMLFDGEATRKNIIDHLQDLQETVTENDKVIIYYAGHGYLDSRRRGYWLPHDAEKRSRATYLRNTQIRESIEDIDARHILLISDSCFSGTLLRDVAMDQLALAKLERERSRWVISSGRQQEPVADGQPGTNSPFTASILKVLRDNQNPLFNAALLFDQASKLTIFKYDQMPQSAPLIRAGHEGGQYIFRLKNDEAAAFETAKQRNTLPAYSHFLRRFPRGQYAEKALSRVVELEEEQVWQKAQRLDRISDYFHYLNRYLEGRYTAEADQAIERLEREVTETIVPLKKTDVDRPATQRKPGRPQERQEEANIFIDPRDGQTYRTVKLNGLRWMADNFNYEVERGCWFYGDDAQYGEKYGRLYTWEAAREACPEGWHLPTLQEWRGLIKHAESAVANARTAPYQHLIKGGKSGFSGQLGGNRKTDGDFDSLGEYGYYWGDTEQKPEKALKIGFNRKANLLNRSYGLKSVGLSCRYVQFLVDEEEKNNSATNLQSKVELLGVISPRESKVSAGSATDIFTDPRDGQTYKTVELNGLRWMAQNLNFDVGEGCWFYDDDSNNGEIYGRLYTWEAAIKACPLSWRLPTDQEWKSLVDVFGSPLAAYGPLIDGGISGLSAQLGGERFPGVRSAFIYIGYSGCYWSATENDSHGAWTYCFSRGNGKLNRNSHYKRLGFSCRCVQDLFI